MESQGKPWIPTLTLENYLNLEHLDVISPPILRKIIMMHGFNCQKVPKDNLLDAVRSIELMDVHHSTLQSDGVSSHALVSLKDVLKDLSVLHWQECCITSMQTINYVTDFRSEVESSSSSSSRKRLKSNRNKVCSSKEEDSQGHEAQPEILNVGAVEGNTSLATYAEQADENKRPKRGIKKPIWMKEYVSLPRAQQS